MSLLVWVYMWGGKSAGGIYVKSTKRKWKEGIIGFFVASTVHMIYMLGYVVIYEVDCMHVRIGSGIWCDQSR